MLGGCLLAPLICSAELLERLAHRLAEVCRVTLPLGCLLSLVTLHLLWHCGPSVGSLQGGDLFQYVKKRGGLREHEARWFFQQLIIGMDYSHRMGVVNRSAAPHAQPEAQLGSAAEPVYKPPRLLSRAIVVCHHS